MITARHKARRWVHRNWALSLLLVAACGEDGDAGTGTDGGDSAGSAGFDVDLDGDGIPNLEDCDDLDPEIGPHRDELYYNGVDDDCDPATVDMDMDGDGRQVAVDCDDEDPGVWAGVQRYADEDGDGHAGTLTLVCLGDDVPDGLSEVSSDCDDGRADVFPGAAIEEPELCTVDADGDGYGNAAPDGGAQAGTDCNDDDASTIRATTGYLDEDGDGAGGDTYVTICGGAPLDVAVVSTSDDCNDANPQVRPGAYDSPDDGVDGDCDGQDVVALEDELDGGAVFVDVGAPCPGAGTSLQPACSLAAALGLASADDTVYVAHGDYPAFEVSEDVRIVGGYTSSDWSRAEALITRVTGEMLDRGGDAVGVDVSDGASLLLDGVVVEGLSHGAQPRFLGIRATGDLTLYGVDMSRVFAPTPTPYRSYSRGVINESGTGALRIVNSTVENNATDPDPFGAPTATSSSYAVWWDGTTVFLDVTDLSVRRGPFSVALYTATAEVEARRSTLRTGGSTGPYASVGLRSGGATVVDHCEILAGETNGQGTALGIDHRGGSLTVRDSEVILGEAATGAVGLALSGEGFAATDEIRLERTRVLCRGVGLYNGCKLLDAGANPVDPQVVLRDGTFEVSGFGSLEPIMYAESSVSMRNYVVTASATDAGTGNTYYAINFSGSLLEVYDSEFSFAAGTSDIELVDNAGGGTLDLDGNTINGVDSQ